jgi:hypothetical protein
MRHATIGRCGEAEVALVAQQLDARIAALRELVKDDAYAGVGRSVVDQHQSPVTVRRCEHARDAPAQIVRRVVDRNDDVDRGACRIARRSGRLFASHAPRIRCHSQRARTNGSRSHQRTLCR